MGHWRAQPVAGQFGQKAGKPRKLDLRMGAIRFIGSGKVGEDALHAQMRQVLQGAQEGRRLLWAQAKPVHAGVDLDMHRQGAAAGCRGDRVQSGGGFEVEDGQGDGGGKRVCGLGSRCIAQHQQRLCDPCLAQLQCFAKGRHGELVGARYGQRSRRLHRAVAVGVGFHHGHQLDPRAQQRPHLQQVIGQRGAAHLDPGRPHGGGSRVGHGSPSAADSTRVQRPSPWLPQAMIFRGVTSITRS